MSTEKIVKAVDAVFEIGEEIISNVGPSLIQPAGDLIKDNLPSGEQLGEIVGGALDFIGNVFGS
nr:hypothetical protein [uncultured Draconibacterium sp.]